MKSRSRPPLILQKRRPARPGSPAAEDEAARRPPAGTAGSDRPAAPSAEAAPEDPGRGGVGLARGSPSPEAGVLRSPPGTEEDGRRIATDRGAPEEEKPAGTRPWALEEPAFWASQPPGSPEEEGSGNEEAASGGLDNSLTNIQWLGKMTSNGLGSCVMKRDTEKENQTPKQKTLKRVAVPMNSVSSANLSEGSPTAATVSSTLWHASFSERPPYSYMAMIQFAINSTEKKCMMLKDIYTWIEDHFPYFKHVAKPGWKNSVRHNLSLHDMFVRETSANGKIAFWTIHPEANRYLTLDQVFKQQKRPTLDLWKSAKGSQAEPRTSRPRIKPLLPRVGSRPVPVQFPASDPLRLQTPSRLPLPAASGAAQIYRGEHPAPKILRSSEEPVPLPPTASVKEESPCGGGSSSLSPPRPLEEGARPGSGEPPAGVLRDGFPSREWASAFLPAWPVKEEPAPGGGEQSLHVRAAPVTPKRPAAGLRSAPPSTLALKRQEPGRSRRKQHLALSSSEEPVLLLPPGRGSPSLPMGHSPPSAQEGPLGSLAGAPGEEGCSETPVKGGFCRPPIASTPNETPTPTSTPLPGPGQGRLAPLVKERSEVDFSPLRPSPLPFLPFQDNLDLLGFHEAPPRPSLCDSPQLPLLNVEAGEIVPGLLTSSPTPSLVASELPGDSSLLEGLALDTMPDHWSRISLDVSFPDTEDDDLETDLSWSQFLPQLK